MAKLGIFDELLLQGVRRGKIPARTQASRDWFRNKARRVSTMTPTKLMNENKERQRAKRATVGEMMTYFYDPKWKRELPYYDRFPLIFLIGPAKGGFLGINLHYLPPMYRAKLMDALYSLANNRRFDEKTKLRISYDILKSAAKFKYFRPCVKHYLASHVRSNFLKIEASEWDIALFLPTESFKKATKFKVWEDSKVKAESSRRRDGTKKPEKPRQSSQKTEEARSRKKS